MKHGINNHVTERTEDEHTVPARSVHHRKKRNSRDAVSNNHLVCVCVHFPTSLVPLRPCETAVVGYCSLLRFFLLDENDLAAVWDPLSSRKGFEFIKLLIQPENRSFHLKECSKCIACQPGAIQHACCSESRVDDNIKSTCKRKFVMGCPRVSVQTLSPRHAGVRDKIKEHARATVSQRTFASVRLLVM